jgi:hypothetical protein
MKGQSTSNRSELKLKMANIFGEEIHTLPTELQEIFLDDLVTAFENRLKVLNRTRSTIEFEIAESVKKATLKT